MKKTILLSCLLFIYSQSIAQRLVKNEIDKFTKSYVKETSEIPLVRKLASGIDVYAKSVDSIPSIRIVVTKTRVFSIPDGGILYMLLSNDSSIQAKCINGNISRMLPGGGKVNVFQTDCPYLINPSDIPMLLQYPVKSIRMDVGDSQYEEYQLKEKHQWNIKRCLELII